MYPTLFHIGSKAVSSHGFFYTLGGVAGFIVILLLSKKQKLPLIEIASFCLFGIIVCVIGGKIYFLIFRFFNNYSYYLKFPGKIFDLSESGVAFHGSVVAGILFALWYLKKFKIGYWKVGDALGPGIALGHSIGRIGCFMQGCCYGSQSSLPWAVTFPFFSHPVHPVQLYEAGLNFFNFLFLILIFKKRRFEGQVSSFYIINYSCIRFFVEFFRGDPERGYVFRGESALTSLSVAQLISLFGVISGIILYLVLRKRKPS